MNEPKILVLCESAFDFAVLLNSLEGRLSPVLARRVRSVKELDEETVRRQPSLIIVFESPNLQEEAWLKVKQKHPGVALIVIVRNALPDVEDAQLHYFNQLNLNISKAVSSILGLETT